SFGKPSEGLPSGAGNTSASKERTRRVVAWSVSHTQALQRGDALAASRWVLNHLSSFTARAGPAKFSRVCGKRRRSSGSAIADEAMVEVSCP
ncbi:MAG TPA: hypothetical protein VNA24_29010, partial [Hyalangium sp.]|nr:hypothetical protein [Hyalangium sp.]